MAQRLKSWESPRNEGRNSKGKGGSARQRQLKKRTQMLRQKLKEQGNDSKNSQGQNKKGEKIMIFSPFLFCRCNLEQFKSHICALQESLIQKPAI